jgi:serine protease inhibitor
MTKIEKAAAKAAPNLPIEGIDHLTKRWFERIPDNPEKGTAFCPVGLWPLLAILADAATPEVRASLEAALGASTSLTDAALALLEALPDRGLSVAAGVWLEHALAVSPSFIKSLPAGTVEFLSGNVASDKSAISAWANKTLQRTIPLEVYVQPDTSAYLANAVLLDLHWDSQFGRDDDTHRLMRVVTESDSVRASPDVTTVRVEGTVKGGNGAAHEVHLVVGREGMPASEVLSAGLRALRGEVEPLTFESAQTKVEEAYPGLDISVTQSRMRRTVPTVRIDMPSFRFADNADFDLEMCGLPLPGRVDDTSDFPGIATNRPIEVSRVNQQVVGDFDEYGFKASAFVQLMGASKSARRPPPTVYYPDVHLEIDIKGPFGYIVLDHKTGVLLFTGWVTEKEWTTEKRPQPRWGEEDIGSFGPGELALQLVKNGPTYGHPGGHYDAIYVPATINHIRVHSGYAFDGLEIDGELFGRRGGTPKDFPLQPGEVVVGFDVQHGSWIIALRIVTNQRSSPWYGADASTRPGGVVTQVRVPPGHRWSRIDGQGWEGVESGHWWCSSLGFQFRVVEPMAAIGGDDEPMTEDGESEGQDDEDDDRVSEDQDEEDDEEDQDEEDQDKDGDPSDDGEEPEDKDGAGQGDALASAPQPTPVSLPVKGVDILAKRWMAEMGNKGTVFSPVGLWPLLAVLADTATDEVRAELGNALGLDNNDRPREQALLLLKTMRETKGLRAAAGIWLRREIAVRPDFVQSLPTGMLEFLTGDLTADKAAITEWASENLNGQLDVAINLSGDSLTYLASAITLNTRWISEFWHRGRYLQRTGREDGTVRTSPDVTTVHLRGRRVWDNSYSRRNDGVEVGQHDVYLVIGLKEASPGEVLKLGLEAIRGAVLPLSFDAAHTAKPGPGLRIKLKDDPVGKMQGTPFVHIKTKPFRVQAQTKLSPAFCGMQVAADPTKHSFPGIADAQLMFGTAQQDAVAEFTDIGFSAAALTEEYLVGAARWEPRPTKAVHLHLTFRRPFGFLAVEPSTGLLLFSGWVTEKEWTPVHARGMAENAETDSNSQGEGPEEGSDSEGKPAHPRKKAKYARSKT